MPPVGRPDAAFPVGPAMGFSPAGGQLWAKPRPALAPRGFLAGVRNGFRTPVNRRMALYGIGAAIAGGAAAPGWAMAAAAGRFRPASSRRLVVSA